MIDSPPAHNAAGVREAIEAGGATSLFIQIFAGRDQLKADLRQAGERTIPRLRRRIDRFARRLTARESV